MKSLCITGLVQDDLNFIMQVLQEAGLDAAKPAERDASVTIEYWHEQVLKLPLVRYTEDLESDSEGFAGESAQEPSDYTSLGAGLGRRSSNKAIQSQNIGRLWEQLASDIFISNLRSDAWGWAAVQSAEVLPFWRRFDPQTRFLLVSVRPERFIAHQIETSDDRLKPDVLLARWKQFHQALLRFHQENRDISLLVDFDDCVSQSGALIKTCNEHFGLGLEIKHFPDVTRQDVSDIARFLAAEICSSNSEHNSFALDLDASLVPVGMHYGAFRVPSPTELIARYRDLKAEAQELRTDELEQQSKAEAAQLELHQVQEELESYFLKHKEVSEQLEQLKKQPKQAEQKSDANQLAAQAESVKKLQQELDQAKKDAAAKKKELDSLKSTNQQLIEREKDTQEENDLLLAQLHQVQEELENYFLKYQDADAKVQSLESRLARVIARHPDDSLVESIEIVSVENIDSDDGSAASDDGSQKSAGRRRLANSGKAASAASKTSPTIHWKIKGLEVGAELHDEIRFASFVEAGVACLVFNRETGGTGVFKRWPGEDGQGAVGAAVAGGGQGTAEASGEETVVISIVGDETTGPKRARALKDLSGTDWQLVKGLVALVNKELSHPKLLKLPPSLAARSGNAGSSARRSAKATGSTKSTQTGLVAEFSAAFAQLQQGFDQLPPLLHFDGLGLGYCQEDSEYEYLRFVFEKAWFGDRMLPEFEFRFASVNVPSGIFGTNPRLEFHEGKSKSAFEDWFEESRDDYGPKLELRFEQPNAMDMNVWNRLVPKDQDLVAALIAQLPVFIDHVKSDSKPAYRNWDDWLKLADDVHSILLVSTRRLGFGEDNDGAEGFEESFGEGESLDAGVEDVEFVEVAEDTVDVANVPGSVAETRASCRKPRSTQKSPSSARGTPRSRRAAKTA